MEDVKTKSGRFRAKERKEKMTKNIDHVKRKINISITSFSKRSTPEHKIIKTKPKRERVLKEREESREKKTIKKKAPQKSFSLLLFFFPP